MKNLMPVVYLCLGYLIISCLVTKAYTLGYCVGKHEGWRPVTKEGNVYKYPFKPKEAAHADNPTAPEEKA